MTARRDTHCVKAANLAGVGLAVGVDGRVGGCAHDRGAAASCGHAAVVGGAVRVVGHCECLNLVIAQDVESGSGHKTGENIILKERLICGGFENQEA